MLKKLYLPVECKEPPTGAGAGGAVTAATWPWFILMDEMLGQRPPINPPLLIASLREDEPGPSGTAPARQQQQQQQEEEEEEEEDGPDAGLTRENG
ncbi:uncharacterized protein LOC121644312 [Xyrichtys novacula]|uniref:Uncharacterized protein LOC121644312 n=1 Tax=Xyrichtys novacula TaxID=13765 RepID=A0AAV1FEB7_XYRNO|nr:uncharacterized protein LOC121644312 [Xyrichtys novacula]